MHGDSPRFAKIMTANATNTSAKRLELVQFRVESEYAQQLLQLSELEGRTRSNYVAQLVREHLRSQYGNLLPCGEQPQTA